MAMIGLAGTAWLGKLQHVVCAAIVCVESSFNGILELDTHNLHSHNLEFFSILRSIFSVLFFQVLTYFCTFSDFTVCCVDCRVVSQY